MSEWATYLGRNRVLVRTTWGAKLLALADDLSLTPDLCAYGEYDAPFVRFLDRVLRAGDTAVDVGANIGLFTGRMAQLVGPAGRVVALEPNPACFEVLTENVSLNYQAEWVQLVPVGADAVEGTATLNVSERFRGNSSLEPREAFYVRHIPADRGSTIEVRVDRLDRLLAGTASVRLLKIDVEGAEHRVLQGAAGLIEDGRIDVIDVEICRPACEPVWDAHVTQLRRLEASGARFALLTDDGGLDAHALDEILAAGWFAHVLALRPGAELPGLTG
jgi:FkbM family methyltransferase